MKRGRVPAVIPCSHIHSWRLSICTASRMQFRNLGLPSGALGGPGVVPGEVEWPSRLVVASAWEEGNPVDKSTRTRYESKRMDL